MSERGSVRTWRLLAALEAIAIIGLVLIIFDGADERSGTLPHDSGAGDGRPRAAERVRDPEPASSGSLPGAVTRSEARAEPPPQAGAGPGTVLHGRVTDPAGAPVEAYVRLTDPTHATTYAECDLDGVYAESGLVPGHYVCRVYCEGHEYLDLTLEIPSGQQRVRRDFVLPASQMIKVRIETSDGSEFYAAMADAGQEWLARAVAVVATSTPRSGSFPLGELNRLVFTEQSIWARRGESHHVPRNLKERYSGALTLRAPSPAHAYLVCRDVILESRMVEPGQREMSFLLDVADVAALAGRVRVQVVEAATGRPLERAQVSLQSAQGASRGAYTGEDSRVEILVAPGLSEMSVWARDHSLARHHRWIRVEPQQTLDLGRIALSREVVISGRVLGPDGVPAGDASVNGKMIGAENFPANPPRSYAITEGGGEFHYSGYLGRGRVLLTARKDGLGTVARVVDTSAGSVDGVVLQLPKGQEVVIQAASATDRVYDLWVRDAEGLSVSHSGSSLWPMDLWLAPGTYRIIATLGLETVYSEYFTVGSGPERVEIELP